MDEAREWLDRVVTWIKFSKAMVDRLMKLNTQLADLTIELVNEVEKRKQAEAEREALEEVARAVHNADLSGPGYYQVFEAMQALPASLIERTEDE